MNLRDVLLALFNSPEIQGYGLAGSANIETASFEFKTRHFPECDCDAAGAVITICGKCGRRPGNNVAFQSGNGDGVYAGVTLWGNKGLDHIGSLYIFDDSNSFAGVVLNAVHEDEPVVWQELMAQGCQEFLDLPGCQVATLTTEKELPLLGGDRRASIQSDYAVIDHLLSEGEEYDVWLFTESVLATLQATVGSQHGIDVDAYTGGFPHSRSPRVALLLKSSTARSLLVPDPVLQGHDWQAQAAAWNKALVFSNFGAGNNVMAMYCNGVHWLKTQYAHGQQEMNEVAEVFWAHYGLQAFGWFLQAAILGHESSRDLAQEMLRSSQGELLEIEQLQRALEMRGWSATPEVIAFVQSLT